MATSNRPTSSCQVLLWLLLRSSSISAVARTCTQRSRLDSIRSTFAHQNNMAGKRGAARVFTPLAPSSTPSLRGQFPLGPPSVRRALKRGDPPPSGRLVPSFPPPTNSPLPPHCA